MAHKTLIDGTAYEIDGGKTLIGGTAYEIDKGKTLVGGTAYEVGFSQMPKITLNIESGPAWIEINSEYYESDGTYEFEVESGTILSCCYYAGGYDRKFIVTVNGTTVVNTTPRQYEEHRYDYTITKNTLVTVTNPGGSWAEVTIIEE